MMKVAESINAYSCSLMLSHVRRARELWSDTRMVMGFPQAFAFMQQAMLTLSLPAIEDEKNEDLLVARKAIAEYFVAGELEIDKSIPASQVWFVKDNEIIGKIENLAIPTLWYDGTP